MKIQISRETTGLGAKGGRSALNLGIELIIIHKEQKIFQRMKALGNLNEAPFFYEHAKAQLHKSVVADTDQIALSSPMDHIALLHSLIFLFRNYSAYSFYTKSGLQIFN